MSETYKLNYLTGRRLKVFLAAADVIIPPDDDAPGGGTLQTAGVVDWALKRVQPGLRSQLLLLLMLIEYMGIFFGGRTFTKNSPRAKERQFAWMEGCPLRVLRMGFFGIKTYASMGYYTREDVWKTIDYEGPLCPERRFPDPVIRKLTGGEIEVIQ